MSDSYLDYKYALDFLKRFNLFVESNPELKCVFEYQNYNLLQAYQQTILGDVLGWSKTKSTEQVIPKTNGFVFVKIICIALFTFVFSVMSAVWLIVSRRDVLVFSMEQVNSTNRNDFRLDPLYGAMKELKIGYLEIIHTVFGRKMLSNLLYRKRPVIYLEAVDFFSYIQVNREKTRLEKLLNLKQYKGFSNDEEILVKTLTIKYGSSVYVSSLRVSFFKAIFTLSGVKKIFAIDDVRTINEVIIAAHQSRIPFYSIQHGHFTKYHVGWLTMTNLNTKIIIPTKTIVWGEYWKRELLRLGTYFTEDQIIIGGVPKFPTIQKKKDDNIISILIPYEKNAPKQEVTQYITDLLKFSDVRILFKLRVDQEKQEQLKEYGILQPDDRITLVRDVDSVLMSVDVVLGTYSTILYDMVALEKPVAILETSIDYGNGMIENGLAEIICNNENLYEKLRMICNTEHSTLVERREKLLGKQEEGLLLQSTLHNLLGGFSK